jgi:uncharacterized protein YceK
MGKKLIPALPLFFFAVAGCGTYGNLYPESFLAAGDFPERHKDEKIEVYGGIQRDLRNLPLGAVDVPFSFIGDTLTLPWTIPAARSGLHSLDKPNTARADVVDSTGSQGNSQTQTCR